MDLRIGELLFEVSVLAHQLLDLLEHRTAPY
jgi:hypothetical protein